MVDYQPVPSHYQLLTVIGKGCEEAASISLAKHLPSGTVVSIKRINLEMIENDFNIVKTEILMTRQLQQDNLLTYYCTFVHGRYIWCVMPLMEYGSCKDLIHAHFTEGLPELAIAYILRDVLMALDYLHTRGIIHRSVKASHILLSEDGRAYLGGLHYSHDMVFNGQRARKVHHFPVRAAASLNWHSPELLEQNMNGYDTKSDIYSLGITACELANGATPFQDLPPMQMLLEKLSGTVPRLLDANTLPETLDMEQEQGELHNDTALFQRSFTPHFHNFVHLCLQADPFQRPNAAQLLNHPYLKRAKRKSSADNLPTLLQPVKPLSPEAILPRDTCDVEDLAEKMSEVEVEEASWIF
ncbi:unnamed protein product [Owenia fusiformis]|uniref:Protein kinase domain-containing protein n=1 Tax=Owenia fusiformis TaxID=6347 RepID=A0A8S4N3N8_OWEFU|nr:unnamed protein product [Owenia fusiformis]